MSGIRWWLLVLIVAVLLVSTAALAKKKKEIRQVVIKEVTKVEGKIQKPEVWYLLPRSNLNFQGLKLENKLVPKIEESTKKDPF
jgi:predicted Holliday junction resolvase-like endonuclease